MGTKTDISEATAQGLLNLDRATASRILLRENPWETMALAGLSPDPWQIRLLAERPSRALLLCARQLGKSTCTAALALWVALFQSPALILLLSPSLRQSGELFRKVKFYLDCLTFLGRPVQESALTLELANGSRIVSLPGSDETVRGYSGARLIVIDEASLVDDDLYLAIRPMLGVSGGSLLLLSTPFGKRGFFYNEWTSGEDWTRFKATALDCPRIPAAFLEEERRHMGDWWFRQEYLCEFNDLVGQLIREEDIQAMLDPAVKPLFPGGASEYSLVDPTVSRIRVKA